MLSTQPRTPAETLHASHVCACADCKRAARKVFENALSAMTFDLAHAALHTATALRPPTFAAAL